MVDRCLLEMLILKYFQRDVDSTATKNISNPHRSISKEVPSSAIERANMSVMPIIDRFKSGKKYFNT